MDDYQRRQRAWAAEQYRMAKGTPVKEADQQAVRYQYPVFYKPKKRGRFLLPCVVVCLVWILCAVFFPSFDRWRDYAIAAGLCALAYLATVGLILAREKRKKTQNTSTQPQVNVKKEQASSGDSELDQLLFKGYAFIQRINAAKKSIQDENMLQQVSRLEELSQKILDYIREKPEKISQIRKFMDYYLPTVSKLLESYARLNRQNVQGENISSTLQKIEQSLQTIVKAFERQLDSLFGSEAMDISSDIAVLEKMLEQEGLADGDFSFRHEDMV